MAFTPRTGFNQLVHTNVHNVCVYKKGAPKGWGTIKPHTKYAIYSQNSQPFPKKNSSAHTHTHTRS